jgi:hypothetical protein
MTRKAKIFGFTVLLGAALAVSVAEENWLMAAIVGAALVATGWLFVHSFPRDLAPPADRRHENTQRRRAGLKPH